MNIFEQWEEAQLQLTDAKCGVAMADEMLSQHMRKLRVSQGISIRRMAKKLELSAPYLSDVELCRRNWTWDIYEGYVKVLKINKEK